MPWITRSNPAGGRNDEMIDGISRPSGGVLPRAIDARTPSQFPHSRELSRFLSIVITVYAEALE